jgi:hypothetical protein
MKKLKGKREKEAEQNIFGQARNLSGRKDGRENE